MRLAQVSGLRAAHAGYFTARPPSGRLAELERYYRVEELGRSDADV